LQLTRKLTENMAIIREKLGIGVSFDVIAREISVGGRNAALVFIDGFVKDAVTADIIADLQLVQRQDMAPDAVSKLLARHIRYFEVTAVDSIEQVLNEIMAGPMALLIDGVCQAIIIDVREYPVRSVEEPDLERVTRGSHEGMVETVVFNTAMIRRRVRDSGLRFEMVQVGTRSKTDVAVGYINDVADMAMVNSLKKKIAAINVDALIMGAKTLEEYLFRGYLNPLPLVRYTERPDVVAAHLFEGHIVVIVDTTPMAMLMPVTAFHFTQHAEEYFQSPLIGTYLRWVRTMGTFLCLFATPLWLALYLQKETLPSYLQFIGPKEQSLVPVALQLFLLEFGLDLIRMALIHTPSALATSLGIVGAILLGDLAVKVGLFVPETILYTAVVAIGYFAIPSIEFAYALRIFRYFLLLAATIGKITGLIIASGLVLIVFVSTSSLGIPYLWPLIPMSPKHLFRLIFRYPIPAVQERPRFTGGKGADKDTGGD
jgi:stage V sporulation protein AF